MRAIQDGKDLTTLVRTQEPLPCFEVAALEQCLDDRVLVFLCIELVHPAVPEVAAEGRWE